MRCSSCSEVVRPVVAIDIDGTLGDYHGHFQDFAERYMARIPPHPPYDGATSHREWFCGMYGVDVRTFRDIKLAYRQGAMKRSMPVHRGAWELTNHIRERAELWLTTTRPYLRLDNIDPDTRFWLRHHGIKYDGLLYDEDKYTRLAERIDPMRVVAVLDDLPEMIEAANVAFGPVGILRANHYNRHSRIPEAWPRALTLRAAERVVLERIDKWEERHA